MKKIVMFVLVVSLILSGCTMAQDLPVQSPINSFSEVSVQDVLSEGMSDSASASVVMIADTGDVLYGHNIHEKRAIASITKIMTAVIALEYAAKNDMKVKVTEEMYAEGSSMYLKAGEILYLSEIVKGMMAVSGNDAANAVAIAVGGTKQKFAAMMNRKAVEIGMKNTSFVTPSGLDDENHYSTAYDMALLCAYAMKNDSFRDIVSQKSVDVSYVEPVGKMQTLYNHNKLLSLCDGCIGIKTGFTKKAGRTLTSCTERDGIRIIAVTLNDGNDWNDHCKLYDTAFQKVERICVADRKRKIEIPLVGGETETVFLVPEKELFVTVRKGEKDSVCEQIYAPNFLYAPTEKNTVEGRIDYIMNEKVVGSVRLITE